MANLNTNTTVRAALRQRRVAELVKTPQGRARIASEATQPLRSRRDYYGVGRKTFLVEVLPDGAIPYYDKDPDVAAFVISEEGDNIESVVKPRRVHVPLFEIASNPTIPLTQIKERRYDVIERTQDLARAQVQAVEDERVFAILDGVAVAGYDSLPGQLNPDQLVVAPISGAVLADAVSLVDRHDLRVTRIYMNARDYGDIRKWGRDILDPESQQVLLRTGLMGTLWGAQIIVSRLVPAGTVYVCADAEMFGRIPVRTELTVISADVPAKRQIGWSVFENLGIACHNPRGLARLTVTR